MSQQENQQVPEKSSPPVGEHHSAPNTRPSFLDLVSLGKWVLEWSARSWRNLATFLVLSMVVGAGFWAYTMPDTVRKLALQSLTEPNIKVSEVEKHQGEILEQTGAVGVAVDLVDFEQNLRRNVFYYVNGKDVTNTATGISPVLPRESPEISNNIVKLIHGQVVCIFPDVTNTPERKLKILKESGIVEACSIGLPPGYSSYFKGILTVYFNEDISDQQENLVELVLTRTSRKIMSHTYGD